MPKKNNRRWRLLADAKFQGFLCLRVAFYWFSCQFIMAGTIFAFSCLVSKTGENTAESLLPFLIPAITISLLVLPIALLDLLAFSNQVAGPLLNFRRNLSRLAEGESVEDIQFRKGDFFPDLCDNFNKIRERMQGSVQDADVQDPDGVCQFDESETGTESFVSS